MRKSRRNKRKKKTHGGLQHGFNDTNSGKRRSRTARQSKPMCNDFKQWRDARLIELRTIAQQTGWVIDREYDSRQGSRYLWLRRGNALIKLRLSNHGIDFRRASRPTSGVTATWSISIEWRGLWQERLQTAVDRLRTAA